MILPQMERGDHGAEVVGMFFFDDNIFCLRVGDPVGERLARLAKANGMLLMVCDQCAVRRGLAEGTFDECGTGSVKAKGMVEGVVCGCFPQLYAALAAAQPDQVITL
jgi:sulfur relay (sulfurtransferase) complex TusBCD TusD component (DsrE family)